MKLLPQILFSIILFFTSCSEYWDEHYLQHETNVKIELWDTLVTREEYSEFIKYIEFFNLDTLLKTPGTKTIFIPDNDAFTDYFNGDTTGFRETIIYHIVPTHFMVRNIEINNYRRLKTYSKKYALIENLNNVFYFDGIEITGTSPLYLDGKYYEIAQVVKPKPNLYEYIKWHNPAMQRYIDLQDSTVLNKEESKPLGFNEKGKTIYDSVTTTINIFEEKYFKISEEYRDIFATLVIPDQSVYEDALSIMAADLGGSFQTHDDIPVDWQNNLLIPNLLHKGIYGGLLNPQDFDQGVLTNIIGDSIKIDFQIDPSSELICSNGIAYEYTSFSIEENLYKENKIEIETLCRLIGLNRFSWNFDKVEIEGNKSFQPMKQAVLLASNDTVVNVDFENNYMGEYAISFNVDHVFPGKHRIVWRTNYRTSGRYALYVNGEQVSLGIGGDLEYDTFSLVNGFFSVLGYKVYPDKTGFCHIDGWVQISEYGMVTIKLVYLGPGQSNENGLSIDYLALLRDS